MKNLLEYLISLKFIFKITYWHMNNPYCERWDREINRLMDEHDFTPADTFYNDYRNGDVMYESTLGDVDLWIQNHPYASFVDRGHRKRPSRLTIERARKKMIKDHQKYYEGIDDLIMNGMIRPDKDLRIHKLKI